MLLGAVEPVLGRLAALAERHRLDHQRRADTRWIRCHLAVGGRFRGPIGRFDGPGNAAAAEAVANSHFAAPFPGHPELGIGQLLRHVVVDVACPHAAAVAAAHHQRANVAVPCAAVVAAAITPATTAAGAPAAGGLVEPVHGAAIRTAAAAVATLVPNSVQRALSLRDQAIAGGRRRRHLPGRGRLHRRGIGRVRILVLRPRLIRLILRIIRHGILLRHGQYVGRAVQPVLGPNRRNATSREKRE